MSSYLGLAKHKLEEVAKASKIESDSCSKVWLVIQGQYDAEVVGTISGYWKAGGPTWMNDLRNIAAATDPWRNTFLIVEIPTGKTFTATLETRTEVVDELQEVTA